MAREKEGDGASTGKVPDTKPASVVPDGTRVVCMCKTRKMTDEDKARLDKQNPLYDVEWASYPLELRTRLLNANKTYLNEMASACYSLRIPEEKWPAIFARAGFTQVDTRTGNIQKDAVCNGFTIYMADCHRAIKTVVDKYRAAKGLPVSKSSGKDDFSDTEEDDEVKRPELDPELLASYEKRIGYVGFGSGGEKSKDGLEVSGSSAENIQISEAWRKLSPEKKAPYEERAARRNAYIRRPGKDDPSSPGTRALWTHRFKKAMAKWV